MNPRDEHLSPIEDHDLDRLVDGELSDADRRELLLRLEHEPHGWRRCALAFLEAQSWKEDLGAMCRSAATPNPVAACAGPYDTIRMAGPPAAASRPRMGTLLAMAASLLVALVLGSTARDWWQVRSGGPVAPRPDLANVGTAGPSVLDASKKTSLPPELVDAAEPGNGWKMVTLAVPPDDLRGADRAVRLPAIEQDRLNEEWIEQFPTALPAGVLRALERTGYQVRQQRQLMPLPMKDGRRLVVPVDRVEVDYVGRPTY